MVVYGLDYTAIAEIPALDRVGTDYSNRDSVVAALKEGRSSVSRPVLSQQMHAPVFLMTVPILTYSGQSDRRVIRSGRSGSAEFSGPDHENPVWQNRRLCAPQSSER